MAAGIGPMLILETMYGMCQTPVLAVAVDLNLFTQLGRDDGSAESLAERTGYSGSGYGRELGVHGIREFTNIKTVWIQ